MSPLKVLISHAHDEKELAAAWKDLLENLSLGAIEVWYSSDSHATGGMDVGKEWRNQLYQELARSNCIIAIQTPFSAGRPWIMWECGVASGIKKIRRIIPIVYSMGKGDMANPLSSYQVYNGDEENQVLEVCERLLAEAGLKRPQPFMYTELIKSYLDTCTLHRPRKVLQVEQIEMWKKRFEALIQSGRINEVLPMRERMYASLPKPYVPIEPTIHELLSRVLLEQKAIDPAIEEVDYALRFIEDDVELLHRKALALVEKHNLAEAQALIDRVIQQENKLRLNPEISSLKGRIHREMWSVNQNPRDLDLAIEAYVRSYEADKTQYYPGINAAELALTKGDADLAEKLFTEILTTCKQMQTWPTVSYWVDFTAGQAYLGLGQQEEAKTEYRRGLARHPAPSPRDRESALKGARRIISARKMSKDVLEDIENILR